MADAIDHYICKIERLKNEKNIFIGRHLEKQKLEILGTRPH